MAAQAAIAVGPPALCEHRKQSDDQDTGQWVAAVDRLDRGSSRSWNCRTTSSKPMRRRTSAMVHPRCIVSYQDTRGVCSTNSGFNAQALHLTRVA